MKYYDYYAIVNLEDLNEENQTSLKVWLKDGWVLRTPSKKYEGYWNVLYPKDLSYVFEDLAIRVEDLSSFTRQMKEDLANNEFRIYFAL